MSNYIRPRRKGAAVFFTVALARRGDDLLLGEIARLRDAVAVTRAQMPFDVLAWVVLPDHMHAVWRLPDGDADYPTRWRLIKGRFAAGLPPLPRAASKQAKGEKGIWQRRYWEHHIRDATDLERHIDYCRTDPERHGLVERASDWPFSSFRRDGVASLRLADAGSLSQRQGLEREIGRFGERAEADEGMP